MPCDFGSFRRFWSTLSILTWMNILFEKWLVVLIHCCGMKVQDLTHYQSCLATSYLLACSPEHGSWILVGPLGGLKPTSKPESTRTIRWRRPVGELFAKVFSLLSKSIALPKSPFEWWAPCSVRAIPFFIQTGFLFCPFRRRRRNVRAVKPKADRSWKFAPRNRRQLLKLVVSSTGIY